MRVSLLAMGLMAATPAMAQTKFEMVGVPAVGEVQVIAAGDPVWTFQTAVAASTTTLIAEEHVKAGGFFSTSGTIDLAPGTPLEEIVTKSGIRACEISSTQVLFTHSRTCLIDTDSDGKFDRWSYNEGSKIGKLDHPVPYHKVTSRDVDTGHAFRITVLYLGLNANTLALSYRESSAGMARPAFTQDLSLPLSSSYPQSVRFKGVEMKIYGIDGLGMKYSITSAPKDPQAHEPPTGG